MILIDLCGGEASEIVVAGDPTRKENVIDFPLSELPRLSEFEIGVPRHETSVEEAPVFHR